jgi:DNA-binding response OmpR family regulator
MSGYVDADVASRFSVSGAAYIQKPFAPDVLSKKVREVLGTSAPAENRDGSGGAASLPAAETASSDHRPTGLASDAPPPVDGEAASRRMRMRAFARSHVAMGALSGRVLIADAPQWHEGNVLEALQTAGFQVDLLVDAASASKKAKEGYDVVIMDIATAGLDALGLVKSMREFDADVAVILLTGKTDTAAEAMDLGAFRSLSTPVSPVTLLAAIQEALQIRRVARLTGEALCRFGDRKTDIGNRSPQRRSSLH